MKQHPSIRFECTKCGECCKQKDMIVTVTVSDILKLVYGLGFTANEVLRALDFYFLEDKQSIPDGLRHIPSIKTERGLAYIALKKHEKSECIFLKDDRCMIHAIRPVVCSSFPFVFKEINNELTWALHMKKSICPGIGEGEIISEAELHSMSQEVLESMNTYREIAKIWNELDIEHTAEGFIDFIISQTS